MPPIFRKLGEFTGKTLRKANWLLQSATGSEEDILKAEQAVGKDLAVAMTSEMGNCRDPEVNDLVGTIGCRLVGCVKNKSLQFNFCVVENGDPNAFALPGGHIFITRSLCRLIDNYCDELAFVLAHEMGHVIKQDPMNRLMNDKALAASIRKIPIAGLATQWIRSAGTKVIQSAYSHDAEFMADKFGARLPQSSGFNPMAGPSLLRRLQVLAREDSTPSFWNYFTSHPPFDERINRLKAYIKSKNGR